MIHPRLLNQLFENLKFKVEEESLGYVVRDIINMNWWNTCEWHAGYVENRREQQDCPENLKLIAVQLKEYYRRRQLKLKSRGKLKEELQAYLLKNTSSLFQLRLHSVSTRQNVSQFFHDENGVPTWVDCTSRATYAAKYVCQNGYVDFDGMMRVVDGAKVPKNSYNLGVNHLFVSGASKTKGEIFSQRLSQRTVKEWVSHLKISVHPKRAWLFDAIKHVRTDPFKKYEESRVVLRTAFGLNECLYGFSTSVTAKHFNRATAASKSSSASNVSRASRASNASNASAASRASRASNASNASAASDASYASHVSYVSRASGASNVSRASRASGASDASNVSAASNASRATDASSVSRASHVSRASDAGTTGFLGASWAESNAAIRKPEGLFYPPVFKANVFALAGHWKIDKNLVQAHRLGWFDPFMGHGESPLLAKKCGIPYVGIDTNTRAFENYLNDIQKWLLGPGAEIQMKNADSRTFFPELIERFDLCYTSPPYFDFEEYGGNTGHLEGCQSFKEFHEKITIPVFTNAKKYLVDGGTLALQVGSNEQQRTQWVDAILSIGGFTFLTHHLQGHQDNKYTSMAKGTQPLLVFIKQKSSSTRAKKKPLRK